MKIVLLLVILVVPIYSLSDKRKSLRCEIEVKKTKSSSLPDTPLHLSGEYRYYGYCFLIITDQSINVIGRSYDYYYKWVFRYESIVKNDKIELSNIEIDENESRFYFSSRNSLGSCKVSLEKEYSYKYKY